MQIVLITWLNLFMSAWALRNLPMDSDIGNLLLCFNEFFIVLSCDLLIIFTDFVPDYVNRYYLGYIYLSLFYASIAFNVACMLNVYLK